MMTEAVKGRSKEEVLKISQSFKAMLQGEPPTSELGDLADAPRGGSKLHARVKCAALPWVTLERALERAV